VLKDDHLKYGSNRITTDNTVILARAQQASGKVHCDLIDEQKEVDFFPHSRKSENGNKSQTVCHHTNAT
jgi:hypothetical protein